MQAHYIFAKHAHHLLMDGEFLILDERADRYILLDRIQSEKLLEAFSSGRTCAILNQLLKRRVIESRHYGVPAKPFNMVDSYTGVDNLTWADTVRTVSENHVITTKQALAALFYSIAAKLLLIGGGLHTTLNRLRRKTASDSLWHRGDSTGRSIAQAAEVAAAVYSTSRYLPFKMHCLETSVAIKLWLDMKRIASRFTIGVQRYDFLAHAWIEVDGIAVGNQERVSRDLPKILQI